MKFPNSKLEPLIWFLIFDFWTFEFEIWSKPPRFFKMYPKVTEDKWLQSELDLQNIEKTWTRVEQESNMNRTQVEHKSNTSQTTRVEHESNMSPTWVQHKSNTSPTQVKSNLSQSSTSQTQVKHESNLSQTWVKHESNSNTSQTWVEHFTF